MFGQLVIKSNHKNKNGFGLGVMDAKLYRTIYSDMFSANIYREKQVLLLWRSWMAPTHDKASVQFVMRALLP